MADEEGRRNEDSKDLYRAVTSSLKESGFLNEVECQTRKEVLKALVGDGSGAADQDKPESNFVINELIREYLDWNNLSQTSQVLVLESGQPQTPVQRSDIESALKIQTGPNSSRVPLLYTIVSALKNN